MPGLQFSRLDLHLHTPASKCYRFQEHTPEQIVQAALDQNLSAIAITDHNTAEWIGLVKEVAATTSLVVFPGVELSTNEGFHVLAIFGPSANQRHVESFLGAVGIKPEDCGRSDCLCKGNVYELVDTIHEWHGLAVLAHIDQPKGAFHDLAKQDENGRVRVPVNCSKLFNEAHYDAVECVSGRLPHGYDAAHQLKRFPALYQASDNPDPEMTTRHSLDGVGASCSWFKLESVNLEGLRQCFADPEVRIKLADEYQEVGYPRIVSMRIGDSGFLRNQTFEFHEGLNSIIGGKGVGKSLAVEFLRFGLGQPPDDHALLEDHSRKLSSRLEPGNSVEICYQLVDGATYSIERQLLNVTRDGDLETSETCIHTETGEQYKGHIPSMFPILAYSQTEVIRIAENRNAQLQLIDRLIDPRPHVQEIDGIRSELAENDKRLNAAILARDRLDSIQREIDTIGAQVQVLNRALGDPLFEEMKQAEQKRLLFDERYRYVGGVIEQVNEWREAIQDDKLESLPKEHAEEADLVQVQQITDQVAQYVLKALETLTIDLGAHQKRISDVIMAWMPEFDRVERRYKQLLRDIGGDREAKERERKNLLRQKAEYEREARELRRLVKDLGTILGERSDLLDALERVYRTYYDVRKSKYAELTALSNGKLQVQLEHAADQSQFEGNLVGLLKGGANSPTVSDRRKIAQNVLPRRFVQLVLDRNATHLASESGLTDTWAERAIEKLWSMDDFTEILALQHNCYPADVPSIRFRKEGGVYGELSELSVGQKCTALLIIALCDGTMPVVIDQPEDALDVLSVWEDISKKLRLGKNSRQFILTTHNSSVAVASDSDQFIVLMAGADRGQVEAAGAIDRGDIRDAVIAHLEGGDEPYKLRARKYNIQ